VSLAESLGVVRVACCEQQGIEACDYSLDVDLAALLDEVETRSKMQFSVPAIGAPFGAEIGGRRIMLDALLHGWTVTRAEQLLESDAARIVEIGGGYGCLARMLYQAGRRDVAIVDLPWVNAIQGYYLLMTLPEGSVSLFGEGAASVQVLPHWCFRQYDQRSIDLVINTNSLPEMSRTTAAAYIEDISRVVRGVFLSVNQESTRHIPATAAQQWVAQLINEHGGYKTISRSRWWMAEGYVEEVFRPIGC
jgi:putative sugar O-methyltransferase